MAQPGRRIKVLKNTEGQTEGEDSGNAACGFGRRDNEIPGKKRVARIKQVAASSRGEFQRQDAAAT